MDINYFLQREQIERVRAGRAASDDARAAHSEMAERYRRLIDDHRLAARPAAPTQGVD